MMLGGFIVALSLAGLVAIIALYNLFLFINGSAARGLIIGVFYAGFSWFLFNISRVYWRIARNPDSSPLF